MKRNPELQRVTLLINLSEGMHAGFIRGIGSYLRTSRGWVVHRRDALVRDWDQVLSRPADGVIACLWREDLHRAVADMGVPVVNVCGIPGSMKAPLVEPDYDAIGKLMCRHLIERGHHRLGFYGDLLTPGRAAVLDAVKQEAAARGLPVACLDRSPLSALPSSTVDARLGDWLAELPKPLGLITAASEDGISAIQRCHERDLDIPEQVSVVSVATENASADLSYPPLSAVQVVWSRMGFEAARVLAAMMAGETEPALPAPQPPTGLTSCRSSEVTAIGDPHLAAALAYIHEHADHAIPVSEVARAAHLSRRTLENRFADKIGRTVFQEIREQQIFRIRSLLLDTNLTLDEICDRSAFANTGHLSNAFREAMGVSPGRFRRRFQSP